MSIGRFYIWNEITDENYIPVCLEPFALRIIKGEISNRSLEVVNISSKDGNKFKDSFFPKEGKIENYLVLKSHKQKEIKQFIIQNSLEAEHKLVYQIIAGINEEISTIFNIINSDKDFTSDLKKTMSDEQKLKRIIEKYCTRYVPSGKSISNEELISISFRFSKPTGSITIKNFHVASAIMDIIRNEYDFNTSISINLEKELLTYKKDVTKRLFKFFKLPNHKWSTNNKAEIHRKIVNIFSLAEVNSNEAIIKKWLAK